MIIRCLSIILIMFSSFLSFAQTPVVDTVFSKDTALLDTFITKLADENVAVDVIMSQYMIIEEPTYDLYDYLEASLEEIRINLLSKNIAEIKYIPFLKMNKKNIKDIDLEGLNPEKVYFLYYKERQMLAIYIEEEKIASFTLVANGKGKAHFVLY